MEPGTSSFKAHLAALDASVQEKGPVQAMEATAVSLRETFGAVVWFAEIFGPRWSHVAGAQEGVSAPGNVQKFSLSPGLGLVVADFGTLTAPRQKEFIAWAEKQASRWTKP